MEPLEREFVAQPALVALIASEMHDAISEALGEMADHDGDHIGCMLHAIWEHSTNRAARMVFGTRRGTLRAASKVLDLMEQTMRENAAAMDPEGLNADWLDGWVTGVGTLTAIMDERRDEVADETEPDVAALVLALPALVGDVPVEVAEWLITIGSGRLIDPAGWLRAQMEQVAE